MSLSDQQEPATLRKRGVVDRLLALVDSAPGLGGGRTHVVFLALFFAVSFSLYLVVLKLRGPASTVLTRTEWDRAFPFTPWWVWVYLLPYAAGPLIAALLSREAFAWYVRRAALMEVVTFAIFLIVPTQTIRPGPNELERLDDGLTGAVYRQMAAIDDPPANAAPSLHVSLSCLLAWALAYDRPRWWPLALMAAVLVWLSTLFTAQHHLIDVVTAVLLASFAAVGGPRRATETRGASPPALA